jgi:hypothetical protein
LQDGPRGAKSGLLVANLDVSPYEKIKELAKPPELTRVDGTKAVAGFDVDDDLPYSVGPHPHALGSGASSAVFLQ